MSTHHRWPAVTYGIFNYNALSHNFVKSDVEVPINFAACHCLSWKCCVMSGQYLYESMKNFSRKKSLISRQLLLLLLTSAFCLRFKPIDHTLWHRPCLRAA